MVTPVFDLERLPGFGRLELDRVVERRQEGSVIVIGPPRRFHFAQWPGLIWTHVTIGLCGTALAVTFKMLGHTTESIVAGVVCLLILFLLTAASCSVITSHLSRPDLLRLDQSQRLIELPLAHLSFHDARPAELVQRISQHTHETARDSEFDWAEHILVLRIEVDGQRREAPMCTGRRWNARRCEQLAEWIGVPLICERSVRSEL